MQENKSTTVNFFDKVRSLAEKRGFKQKDLAKICGVSTAAVSKWYSGGDIKLDHAVKLANIFGINLTTVELLAPADPRMTKESRSDYGVVSRKDLKDIKVELQRLLDKVEKALGEK